MENQWFINIGKVGQICDFQYGYQVITCGVLGVPGSLKPQGSVVDKNRIVIHLSIDVSETINAFCCQLACDMTLAFAKDGNADGTSLAQHRPGCRGVLDGHGYQWWL